MRKKLVFAVAGLALFGLCATARAEPTRIKLDRCIAGKCTKFGRVDTVTLTDEFFLVRIDPHRCRDQLGYTCPTRYDSFVTEDGSELRITGYEPGEKSDDMFTVYVPIAYRELHIRGVGGKPIDDVVYLSNLLEAQPDSRAPDTVQPPSRIPALPPAAVRTLDELFERLLAAWEGRDAEAVARLFTDDARVLPPQGPALEGRDAIREHYATIFAMDGELPAMRFVSVSRDDAGSVAYESGRVEIIAFDGKREAQYLMVFERHAELGWRVAAAASTQAGLSL